MMTLCLVLGFLQCSTATMMGAPSAAAAATRSSSSSTVATVVDVEPGLDVLHEVLDAHSSSSSNKMDTTAGRRELRLRLASGTHRLSHPLRITPEHGKVSFIGVGNASISGGVPVVGWTKDPAKPGRWKAPTPAGFNTSGIGTRMQLWRGDTRLVLARSPVLTYVHANSTFITFKGTDIAQTYHDFAHVYLVLYESWTASMHMMSRVDTTTHRAYLASTYNAKWANSASGARYYIENALEHLDANDEFYVDHLSSTVYLQSNTNPNVGPPIELAAPQELLTLGGSPNIPLRDAHFSNIEFGMLCWPYTTIISSKFVMILSSYCVRL
jgi:hypothetical protein